jgi:hypothetical protein
MLSRPSRRALVFVTESDALKKVKEFDYLDSAVTACGEGLHRLGNNNRFVEISEHLYTHSSGLITLTRLAMVSLHICEWK